MGALPLQFVRVGAAALDALDTAVAQATVTSVREHRADDGRELSFEVSLVRAGRVFPASAWLLQHHCFCVFVSFQRAWHAQRSNKQNEETCPRSVRERVWTAGGSCWVFPQQLQIVKTKHFHFVPILQIARSTVH